MVELSEWAERIKVLDATKQRLLINYEKVWGFYIEAQNMCMMEQQIASLLTMKICIYARHPDVDTKHNYIKLKNELKKNEVSLKEARDKYDKICVLMDDFLTQMNNVSKSRDELSDLFEALVFTMQIREQKKIVSGK
jgi:hypothetical protein